MTEWISVKDRLPDFDIMVLCYDTQKIYIGFRPEEEEYNEHWSICEETCCSCNGCTGAITHWMPLPKSPEENEIANKSTPASEELLEDLRLGIEDAKHGRVRELDILLMEEDD